MGTTFGRAKYDQSGSTGSPKDTTGILTQMVSPLLLTPGPNSGIITHLS